MKIFHFGKHDVPMADIRDIHLEYNYQNNEIYVDLEINGGAQLSLNLPDSVAFMEQFIATIRETKNI